MMKVWDKILFGRRSAHREPDVPFLSSDALKMSEAGGNPGELALAPLFVRDFMFQGPGWEMNLLGTPK
jgi:hypothetical protein